jgi:hypothetical protein
MDSNEEFIYNWSNSLRQSNEGLKVVIAQQVEGLKREGYASDDIADILIADNYHPEIVEAAVKEAFSIADSNSEFEPKAKSVKAYVAPTSYDDIKPFVEKTLSECTAKEFVDRLTKSEYPIISKLANKKYESLVRIATIAKENSNLIDVLHKELLPFMELAMYKAVEACTNSKNRITVAETKIKNRFTVASSMQVLHTASVENGSCDCDEYVKGNYADFGMACKHLVALAMNISPNEKLERGNID